MTTNRSGEELAMRDVVEAWGRARWPSARVVHELVVGEKRIDMAFISPRHLAGVEIKSSKDKLDRLKDQVDVFVEHLPEVWCCYAPKWIDDTSHRTGTLIVDIGHDVPIRSMRPLWKNTVNRAITVPMLWLLWRDELVAIAARKRLDHGKRSTIPELIAVSARVLTGDEIVEEVCRELRGRDAFWKSDPPIKPETKQ